jgi:Flp pilus assembly protein TadD
VALSRQGKEAEAEKLFRRAIALDPRNAQAHTNLGAVLDRQGKQAEAEKLFRRAIALDPGLAVAHTNLGWVLGRQGKEAEEHHRRAIALDPRHAQAHNNLGSVLVRQGKAAEAEKLFRRAIALDPRHAQAHNNLGSVLVRQGKAAEAEKLFRRAIALDPGLADAHTNLGGVLGWQGKLPEAEKHLRQAITLDPRLALAHIGLGWVLERQGKPAEALPLYRQALALDPRNALALQRLPLVERMAAVEAKLPAFLKGDFRPSSNDDRLALAQLCKLKCLYRASAGLYADAFAADPKVADDLKALHRYNAACYAALAAAGKDEDAAELNDKERLRLREQALGWLKADLALRSKQLEGGKPADRAEAQAQMRHWQKDPDLAGVRDPAALAKLPEAERLEWQKFWKEVEALLAKAGAEKAGK